MSGKLHYLKIDGQTLSLDGMELQGVRDYTLRADRGDSLELYISLNVKLGCIAKSPDIEDKPDTAPAEKETT